jgi:hypothetical protein
MPAAYMESHLGGVYCTLGVGIVWIRRKSSRNGGKLPLQSIGKCIKIDELAHAGKEALVATARDECGTIPFQATMVKDVKE